MFNIICNQGNENQNHSGTQGFYQQGGGSLEGYGQRWGEVWLRCSRAPSADCFQEDRLDARVGVGYKIQVTVLVRVGNEEGWTRMEVELKCCLVSKAQEGGDGPHG